MYITVKSVKRKVGFKGIELMDLVIGLPILFILLLMFSFSKMRMLSVVLFIIAVFLFLPINLSKKNRMYKVMNLVFKYIKDKKRYFFYREQKRKEGKMNGILKRI